CFFFQAEDGIRDFHVTGVQTCALPISTTGVMALLAIAGLLPLPVFVLFESLAMLLFGLVGPNLNTLAMQPMAHIAGTASAALGRSEERRVGKECRSGWSGED